MLETMRALQAEVATSRVEIAASRADNEELRRANEELRRDLQLVGEHAVDERAPPVPLRARLMPFSQTIMDTTLPTTSLCLKVTFTGVEDPEAHLTAFHNQMMLTGGSDVVYCKLLMSTLAGVVLDGSLAFPTNTSPPSTSLLRCLGNNTLLTRPPLDFPMMSSILNSIRGSP